MAHKGPRILLAEEGYIQYKSYGRRGNNSFYVGGGEEDYQVQVQVQTSLIAGPGGCSGKETVVLHCWIGITWEYCLSSLRNLFVR